MKKYIIQELKQGHYWNQQKIIWVFSFKNATKYELDEAERVAKALHGVCTIVPVYFTHEEIVRNAYVPKKREAITINALGAKQKKTTCSKEEKELLADIQHVCAWYQGRDVDRCVRVEEWIKENL